MKLNRQLAAVLVMVVMAPGSMLAQNSRVYRDGSGWVEEISGSLPQARALRLNTDMGSVEITGGSSSEIKYVVRKHSYTSSEDAARSNFQEFHASATRRGDVATIEGSWEGGHSRKFNAEFILEVPRNLAEVSLNTDGGQITVRSISGRVQAETGGGAVHLDDLTGPVKAETGGGAIEVGNTGNELNLNTGGGNIRVNAARGRLVATSGGGNITVGNANTAALETGGGSIHVENCGGDLRAETGGGMIELGAVDGPVSLETGGGSIRVSGARGPVRVTTGGGSIELWKLAQGGRAETGAGSITAEFIATPAGASLMETSAGDLTVYIASNVKVTIDAAIDSAFGHKINSDFPEVRITSDGGDWGPRELYAKGNLNGGGPVLKLRASTGNINIRRDKQ